MKSEYILLNESVDVYTLHTCLYKAAPAIWADANGACVTAFPQLKRSLLFLQDQQQLIVRASLF